MPTEAEIQAGAQAVRDAYDTGNWNKYDRAWAFKMSRIILQAAEKVRCTEMARIMRIEEDTE